MTLAFWAWIVVAVVCLLGESLTGGGFTWPWAVGGAVAAGLEAWQPGGTWQWVAFVAVASILTVVTQRLRRR
ncbi:MAG: hypothetical protein HGB10_06115 [Coriobacteriia bacterium]|nr:hypothetical protein [Coriobacteriia bacterium]